MYETSPSDGVMLRRVRAGDGGVLHQLFLSSIHELAGASYTAVQIDAWTSQITPERLETRLLQTVSFVAEHQGTVVGFGSLDANHAELDFLYVDPRFVRRGIGRRLTTRLEEAAATRGAKRVELTASLNAEPAYARLGYARLRAMMKTIGGTEIPCVRMGKALESTL